MQKIVKFNLNSKFGHFNYPFTSPNHLKKTFNIIPRTSLLGILGSILGLSGYGRGKEPEFYIKLNHIPVSINLKEIFNKDIITYNSLNSFANNGKIDSLGGGSNVIIKEEILLNPEFDILLLLNLDNKIDNDLFNIFEKGKKENSINSVYHIYLGKNEFFANISNIKIIDEFKIESTIEPDNIVGIFPKNLIEKYDGSEIIYDSFSKDIDFSNKKIKTELIEVVYFFQEDKQEPLYLINKVNFIKIKDQFYYFF